MIAALASKLGFVPKSEVIAKLQFARSVGKRLDEHREVVNAIAASTSLFQDCPWHIDHMAVQDDYLMRLYRMVHGHWPSDSDRCQVTGEVVRSRPAVLGKCGLPEFGNGKR